MNMELTPELERFVRRLVESGRFPTASAVVCAALERLREEERAGAEPPERLRAALARGLEQADRGELLDGEQVLADLRAELASR